MCIVAYKYKYIKCITRVGKFQFPAFCYVHLFCIIKFSFQACTTHHADHIYDEMNEASLIFLLPKSDFADFFCIMRVKGGIDENCYA